ncbi:O-methyltransferase [Enterococcus sp. AZ192]|uniref:O-methyltransferase n=1 Tax=unclassified Enterococcus TaxID=2608891 RepID=UPI003D27C226
MTGQPFYHLRPNKFIDRQMFLKTLLTLGKVLDFKDYCYIGFGSYLFDDFKLVHNKLGVKEMISLESDPNIAKRAEFNKPLKCIDIKTTNSSDFLAEFSRVHNNYIVWLDFTSPSNIREQFSDFSTILNVLEDGDIVRITLNANSSSLGFKDLGHPEIQEKRLEELRNRLEGFLPNDIDVDEVSTRTYPLLLLKSLKKTSYSIIAETKYDHRFIFPLLSTIYQDGQKMLTLTLIILEDHEKETEIIELLTSEMNKPLNETYYWGNPEQISIPPLTTKEILEINSLLPTSNPEESIWDEFQYIFDNKKENFQNYIEYYQIYPHFNEVSF